MTAIVGQYKTQVISNPKDTASLYGFECGNVRIQLLTPQDFLNLTYVEAKDEYLLEFNPISEDQVCGYVIVFRVYLEDYESVSTQHQPYNETLEMSLIVQSAINEPPYFISPLDEIFPAQIQLS